MGRLKGGLGRWSGGWEADGGVGRLGHLVPVGGWGSLVGWWGYSQGWPGQAGRVEG